MEIIPKATQTIEVTSCISCDGTRAFPKYPIKFAYFGCQLKHQTANIIA